MNENVTKEQKNKLIPIIISIINIIAIICLIYLAIPYLKHDTGVNNPNAMIAAESWDMSGFLLTIGLIPLIIANIFAYKFIELKNKILKLLFFIPSIICIIIVVHYLFVSFVTNEGESKSEPLYTITCHLSDKDYNYDIYLERNNEYSVAIEDKDSIPLGQIDYSSYEAIKKSISDYYNKKGGNCE